MCAAGAAAARLRFTRDPSAALAGSWDYLGPFPVGKSELDGDPAAGAAASGPDGRAYDSELVPGGLVRWARLPAEGKDVSVAHGGVDWNGLVAALGGTEVLEHQGWAVGNVSVGRGGRYSVRCSGLHTVFVGGVMLAADQCGGERRVRIPISRIHPRARSRFVYSPGGRRYGTGEVLGAVTLPPGPARVAVHVRAKVRPSRPAVHAPGCVACARPPPHTRAQVSTRFSCEFSEVPSARPLLVLAARIVPDLVAGALASPHAALQVRTARMCVFRIWMRLAHNRMCRAPRCRCAAWVGAACPPPPQTSRSAVCPPPEGAGVEMALCIS